MEDKIKNRITKLFEVTLKIIEVQTNCNHVWKDKNGTANFRCGKCGYLVDDRKLDALITIKKLREKGLTPKIIKNFKKNVIQ